MEEVTAWMRSRDVPASVQRRIRSYYAYTARSRHRGLPAGSALHPTLALQLRMEQCRQILGGVALFRDASLDCLTLLVERTQVRPRCAQATAA